MNKKYGMSEALNQELQKHLDNNEVIIVCREGFGMSCGSFMMSEEYFKEFKKQRSNI